MPRRLLAFARRKRRAFLAGIAQSVVGGFTLGRLAAWACGNADAFASRPVLESGAAMLAALAAGVAASALA